MLFRNLKLNLRKGSDAISNNRPSTALRNFRQPRSKKSPALAGLYIQSLLILTFANRIQDLAHLRVMPVRVIGEEPYQACAQVEIIGLAGNHLVWQTL